MPPSSDIGGSVRSFLQASKLTPCIKKSNDTCKNTSKMSSMRASRDRLAQTKGPAQLQGSPACSAWSPRSEDEQSFPVSRDDRVRHLAQCPVPSTGHHHTVAARLQERVCGHIQCPIPSSGRSNLPSSPRGTACQCVSPSIIPLENAPKVAQQVLYRFPGPSDRVSSSRTYPPPNPRATRLPIARRLLSTGRQG